MDPTTESQARTVAWTEMADGTAEDYEYLQETFTDHARGQLVTTLCGLLGSMRGPTLGYQIDRYEHSLQSATRAQRAGERDDLVVAALLHDVADTFAPENHSDAAATLLAPYVDEEAVWVVRHHGIFQGYYYFHHLGGDRDARERYRDHEWFDACAHFCESYDQNCFDPAYDSLPLEAFMPLLDDVFSRPSRLPAVPVAR